MPRHVEQGFSVPECGGISYSVTLLAKLCGTEQDLDPRSCSTQLMVNFRAISLAVGHCYMDFCAPTISFSKLQCRRLSCRRVLVMLRVFLRPCKHLRHYCRGTAPPLTSISAQCHSKLRRHRRYRPPRSARPNPQRSSEVLAQRFMPGVLVSVRGQTD